MVQKPSRIQKPTHIGREYIRIAAVKDFTLEVRSQRPNPKFIVLEGDISEDDLSGFQVHHDAREWKHTGTQRMLQAGT